jgi:hypothetical protein
MLGPGLHAGEREAHELGTALLEGVATRGVRLYESTINLRRANA